MIHIGLDIGSVSVKIAVLDGNGSILHSDYLRHRGHPLNAASDQLKKITEPAFTGNLTGRPGPSGEKEMFLSVTGSAGRLLGSILAVEPVNEVVSFAFATRKLYPHVRTIIELGGEDSKLIILSEDGDAARDFSMNSVCAAGTGSFLDQQAERLRLTIEEFSELSLKSSKPPRIAGRCSVFAKSDMIHLQQIATPVEDIVAGLCFAVARNFKGSIVRGRELVPRVSFQGGVAANKGMIRAFREVFGLEDLLVPPEFALTGAIGAVLKDRSREKFQTFDISRLEAFLTGEKRNQEPGFIPLISLGDGFAERHLGGMASPPASGTPMPDDNQTSMENGEGAPDQTVRAYLGVDIGSISTNLVVIDEDCHVMAKRYLMTAGRPIEAVMHGLEEIGQEIGHRVEICGVGTTGSGRYMIADYIGADIVKNEITAQARAAAFIDPGVDTIFEIGGQDSKYISLRNGVIADFEMNKACAAGTGSFLEEQAEKLDISIRGEFQELAFASGNPCRLGERCTVFMENSLMANLQRGTDRKDLFAGLAYSIVQNYINRVVCRRPVGDRIFFQGGVAFNKSVVAAFEKYLGKKVIVPPHHEVTGAIGMALIAKEFMEQGPHAAIGGDRSASPVPTSFKGFELAKRKYEISSFECRGCPNVCEINKVKVEGEKNFLFYGGRCEKYEVKRKKTAHNVYDLFAFRDDLLWKSHSERAAAWENAGSPPLPRIGIPYIFFFQDFLPYWTTLLWELGFSVEVSPKTDKAIVDRGLESVLSETCFPVKTAHGHVKYLMEQGSDYIFMPSFVNLNTDIDSYERGVACPYTQTIPYMTRTAFPRLKTLSPVVDFSRGREFLVKELYRCFRPLGISSGRIRKALIAADRAQESFSGGIREKGREVLESLQDRAVVIVGRAYNSFDRGMNLDIPKKLADLGVLSIPLDFIPWETSSINGDWPNMYWRSGQRILSSARYIRSNSLLYALYIGNFSCGPDSFIIKFFDEEMSGKPYLHLEIDAHSADAGAITRCEAFLDSIDNARRIHDQGHKESSPVRVLTGTAGSAADQGFYRQRKIFIPRMSDHAFALQAAFEYCGLEAEVLPESSHEAVEVGKKFVSGKECYPCAVTTGDMAKKILEPGFDPEKSAFFMPSGSGPCRFGQYNVFHKIVVKELGFADIPIFAPNQDENFYRSLGIVGRDFSKRSWEGIIAIELLTKSLHETRPYEKQIGSSDDCYRHHLDAVVRSVRGVDGGIEDVLRKARNDFESIPRYSDERPLIGIVGEIFVRSNRFSNEDLVRKIESLGGEAYLAPVEEWIHYVTYVGLRKVLIKKEWSGIMELLLKQFFQKRTELRLVKHFGNFLRNLHEPETRTLVKAAGPYIHSSFEGEAILSIGKSIELLRGGACGIVNAMPFGCMPGTIVSGLMRGITEKFVIPCLSIPYDGTESLTTEIQLEAFIDQAREYGRRTRRSAGTG